MATFVCSQCDHSAPAKDKYVGKKARCPKCGKTGTVENLNSPDLSFSVNDPPPLNLSDQKSNSSNSGFSILKPRLIFEFLDNNSNLVALLETIWRIIVGLFSVLFLLSWLLQCMLIFRLLSETPGPRALFLCATQIVLLVSAGTAAYIMWFRSFGLSGLKSSSNRFVVIPSLAKFVSAAGEALAAMILIFGVSSAFLLASRGESLADFVPLRLIETDFIRSIASVFVNLVCSAVAAILIFLAGRLFSEMLNVVYSIANDIRMLSENSNITREENAV